MKTVTDCIFLGSKITADGDCRCEIKRRLLLGRNSQVAQVVKNPLANAGDIKDAGSIPGLGRSPGEGNGNTLQYSCLENPMDRRAWRATVHRVKKSRTRLKQLSTLPCTCILNHSQQFHSLVFNQEQ